MDILKINPERKVQNRVINLLHRFNGYTYLGNFHDTENKPYIEEITKTFLIEKQGCTESQASEAMKNLKDLVAQCTGKDSLYHSNKEIYHLLRYPTSVSQGVGKPNRQVSLIDWIEPESNFYHIAEEVTVARTTDDGQHRRPDVVIYVNGIAMAVIELKKATVSALDGIKQQIRNQEDGQIAPFFTTAQLLLAGSESEGIFYGTTLTTQKFYLHWKEPAGQNYSKPSKDPDSYQTKFAAKDFKNELDRTLLQMLEPSRLLDFIYNCVVFDGGIKKVARPNQYFAIQAAKTRIREKENGIIWHSQGAGKSLTMVWLAQWILENIDNSRVVIITDREELDIQITNGFVDTGRVPIRATSGDHLIKMLNGTNDRKLGKDKREPACPDLITTLLHKFGIVGNPNDRNEPVDEETIMKVKDETIDKRFKGKRSPEQYMQEIAEHLPKGFKAKGNLYVFVDECHRTQGGILNKAMRKIMGDDVMLIGFTGTPLLKSDKDRLTSREAFGPWISTYKFNEAVKDGVILDLRYEARNVEQNLSNTEDFDEMFECHTKNLTDKAKEQIQKRWGIMQNLFSSKDRVNRIVAQIYKDFTMIPYLREGWGNAMLVADSIYQAYRFWEVFENNGYFKGKTAVISSYAGEDPALSDGYSGELKTEAEFKYEMFNKMVGQGRTAEQFEAYAKKEFIDHPGNMKVIIVVDKLLTGFDAPSATYIYIDKEMRDHTLFQAICRVNRTNGERKQYGYIIDHKNLFQNIEGAIEDYTNGNFEAFDKVDVEGLLKGRLTEAKKDLEDALEKVKRLSEPVQHPKGLEEFFDYFCYDQIEAIDAEAQIAQIAANTQKRDNFYDACHNLVRRYVAIATEMESAGFTEAQATEIYNTVRNYDAIRVAIMHRCGDYVDFKAYDAEMRALLDNYVTATRVEVLEKLDDFSFLDIIQMDSDGEVMGTNHEAEGELGGQNGIAETMTSAIRRVINRKRESNPEEYKYFSERINRLIEEYQQKEIEYKKFLQEIIKLAEELKAGKNIDPRIDTNLKKALHDNLGKDIELALAVYAVIEANAKSGFRENMMRRKKLLRAIENALESSDYSAEAILNLVIHNNEF